MWQLLETIPVCNLKKNSSHGLSSDCLEKRIRSQIVHINITMTKLAVSICIKTDILSMPPNDTYKHATMISIAVTPEEGIRLNNDLIMV